MCLVEASVPYVPSANEHFVKLVYETLTDTLVAEVDDKIIEGVNGISITERKLIALAGVSFSGTVGSSTYNGKTLIEFEEENTDAYTRVTARYSEGGTLSTSTSLRNQGKLEIKTAVVLGNTAPSTPVGFTLISTSASNTGGFPTTTYTYAKGDGQVSVTYSAGPTSMPGSIRRTVRAFGAELIPDGVLIESNDVCRDGYVEYTRTTLDLIPDGVHTTYEDVTSVETPGTVACTTVAVAEDNVSGTLAIPTSTPRRQKQVDTVVTIEVSETIPTGTDRAYDLGAISCSVLSVQTKLQAGDGSVATAVDGSTTLSQVGFQKSFASSANSQSYPGSYLTATSSTGSVDYQSSSQPYLSAPNAISAQNAFSYSSSTCTGTGATTAEGYSETGVISRDVRTILTALDGTIYYEIVTVSTV